MKRNCLSIVLLALLAVCLLFFSRPSEGSSDIPAYREQTAITLPVIMYHCVVDSPKAVGDYVITPAIFENDMNYLLEQGYETIFASDLLAYVDLGVPLPKKPVLITFDDGQYGFLEHVLPILDRLDQRALLSIEGAFADLATEEDPLYRSCYSYLTWEEIAVLADTGLVEIGNHTYNMHQSNGLRKGCKMMPGESEEAYRRALFEDIGLLQTRLQEICGHSPVAFAYPFGHISKESYSILDEMGFRVLLTCYEKTNYLEISPGCTLILNRYNRPGGLSTEQFMSRILDD